MKTVFKYITITCILITILLTTSCKREIKLTGQDQKLLVAETSEVANNILTFIPEDEDYSFDFFYTLVPDSFPHIVEYNKYTFESIDTTVQFSNPSYRTLINTDPAYTGDSELLFGKADTGYFIGLFSEAIPQEGLSHDEYSAVIVQKFTGMNLTFCIKNDVTLGKYTYTHLGFADKTDPDSSTEDDVDIYYRVHNDKLIYIIQVENSSAGFGYTEPSVRFE